MSTTRPRLVRRVASVHAGRGAPCRIGTVMERPRLLADRSFPHYAYLPGRGPHPVRDPAGHSYNIQPTQVTVSLDSDEFAWGQDLFNHGYYWEAHEAWEALWQVAEKGSPMRALLKGLILLSASGVKIRERKRSAAMRHAGRAGALLRELTMPPHQTFSCALAISPTLLADLAEATASAPPVLHVTEKGRPEPVFSFILGKPGAQPHVIPDKRPHADGASSG